MFQKILSTAMDSSAEVIVETKYSCDGVRGKVLECDDTYFTLFHSGPGGGVLWAFRLEDIAYCGVVMELPCLDEEERLASDDGTVVSASSNHAEPSSGRGTLCLPRPEEEDEKEGPSLW